VWELAQALSPADQRWLVEQLNQLLEDEPLPERATLTEAIELYLADKCSLGRAAELAGVTRWEMMEILYERGIPTNGGHDFTPEEMETMLEVVETRYGYRE
jgi:predicted HTH domain antitoxin